MSMRTIDSRVRMFFQVRQARPVAEVVHAYSAIAADDLQQTAVVQRVHEMCHGTRGAAPVVSDVASAKSRFDIIGMHGPMLPDVREELVGMLCGFARQRRHVRSGMHQSDQCVRCEAVIDEEVFRDRELRVFGFQVSGTVIFDAMTKNEVLRACRRPDGIGLNVAELVQCGLQRRGRKQSSANRVRAQRSNVHARATAGTVK